MGVAILVPDMVAWAHVWSLSRPELLAERTVSPVRKHDVSETARIALPKIPVTLV